MPFTFSGEDLDSLSFPVPHLNGTGKETLKEEYLNALDKLAEAIDAFYKTTFHQRDFYPIDDSACSKFYKAQALRDKMKMMYKVLADYLQAHVESLTDGENADWIVKSLKKDVENYR